MSTVFEVETNGMEECPLFYEGAPYIYSKLSSFPVTYSHCDFKGRVHLQLRNQQIVKRTLENTEAMCEYYRKSNNAVVIPADKLEVGMIVAGSFNSKMIHMRRLRVIQKNSNGNYTVVDLDDGKFFFDLPTSLIFFLAPQFIRQPFQMAPCFLEGLEVFEGTEVLHQFLAEKNAEMYLHEMNVSNLRTEYRGNGEPPLVRLYRQFHEPSISDVVIDSITSYTPSLPVPMGGMISHAEPDGLIYIQKDEPLLRFLVRGDHSPLPLPMGLFDRTDDAPKAVTDALKRSIKQNKEVFFAKSVTDGRFYRIKILYFLRKPNRFKAQFLEFGNVTEVFPKDMRVMTAFGDPYALLENIRPQAIAAQMAGIGYLDVAKFTQHFDVDETNFSFEIEPNRGNTKYNPDVPLVNVFIHPEGKVGSKFNFNEFLLNKGVAAEEYVLDKLVSRVHDLSMGTSIDNPETFGQ